MRLKLTVAYDGASFAGWQSQAHGRAVQDILEAAALKVAGSRIVVHGSGRTDAGVHALGQCAHIEVPNRSLGPLDWRRALNAGLPPGVRVMSAQWAAPDFHARFSVKGKIYRYVIRTAAILPPHEAHRVWHFPQKLDGSILEEAAKIFVGRHDFAAFTANARRRVRDTRRTIRALDVRRRGTLITVTFEGEGFLYKMVRMLTGAMVRAAQGRKTLDDVRSRLKNAGPRWNYVAPGAGLYLVRVIY